MARKPARIKSKKPKTNLTVEQIEILMNGYSFESLLDDYQGSPFIDENHQRDMWKRHNDYILNTYRDRTPNDDDENTFPSGTRPWGFWKYDRQMEPPENQTEYLAKYDLLTSDELWQAKINAETQKRKLRFRLSPEHELYAV